MVAGVHVMDGHQYPTTCTQWLDVQIQQVLVGERLKYAHVNFTFDEVFWKVYVQ